MNHDLLRHNQNPCYDRSASGLQDVTIQPIAGSTGACSLPNRVSYRRMTPVIKDQGSRIKVYMPFSNKRPLILIVQLPLYDSDDVRFERAPSDSRQMDLLRMSTMSRQKVRSPIYKCCRSTTNLEMRVTHQVFSAEGTAVLQAISQIRDDAERSLH